MLYNNLIFPNILLFWATTNFWVLCVKSNVPSKQDVDTFKRLFQLKRLEQLEAVKKISKLPESKQQKMVETISKAIFEVIHKSRTVLETSGYTPGISSFPDSENIRDALSLVVENTALLGELVLRVPDVADKVVLSTSQRTSLLTWCLSFVNQTQLLDINTNKLMYLVSQELNITERSPDFINPYRKRKSTQVEEKVEDKKKKKKKEIHRGPRLTLPQVGEL